MSRSAHRRHRTGAVLLAVVLATATLGACGDDGGDEAGSTTTATSADGDGTTTSSDAATTSAPDDVSSTGEVASSSEVPTPSLPDAALTPRSAPADGTGTALLRAVRVGANEGFDRIVFEFEGTSMPGYRIAWVDPPIRSDGSGEVVDVEGDAFLEMVMEPASGVDLSAPELEIVYEGPDRVPADQSELVEELVRTGDFEAVLTWVAGATEEVPFRVLTLTSPTRVVVDLATS